MVFGCCLTLTTDTDEVLSHHTINLTNIPIFIDQVRLYIDEKFFDREFLLFGKNEDNQKIVLTKGNLRRSQGQKEPIDLKFEPVQLLSLQLDILNGNDAPLTIANVEIRAQLADLYVAAPEGEYRLLLGYSNDKPPIYELTSIRENLLKTKSGHATVGELTSNPDFRPYAQLREEEGFNHVLLWTVLIIAVIVLGILTLRMSRSDGDGDNSSGNTPTTMKT